MANEFLKGHITSKRQIQDCQTPEAISGLLSHQIDWGYIVFYLTNTYIVPDTVSFRYSHRTILSIVPPRKSILVLSAYHSPLATLQLPLPLKPLNTNQPRPVWISLQKAFLLLYRTLIIHLKIFLSFLELAASEPKLLVHGLYQ